MDTNERLTGRGPDHAARRRGEPLLFFFLVAVSVVPVWLGGYFASTDGPAHLWIVDLLLRYLTDDPSATAAREFIVANRNMEPNLGFYAMTLPLLWLLGAATAEKVTITLTVFALCYGARYAVRALNPSATLLAYLAIPLALSYFAHMGFHNFQLGVALLLPGLAFAIQQHNDGREDRFWKIGLTALVLVCAHLVAFVAFVVLFGGYVAGLGVAAALRERSPAPLWRVLRDAPSLAMTMSAAFFIVVSFLLRHGGADDRPSVARGLLIEKLASASFLRSFDVLETWLVSAPFVAALVVAAVVVAARSVKSRALPNEAIALACALGLLFVLFMIAPVSTRDVPLSDRLAPMLALTAIVTLAAAAGRADLRLPAAIAVACVLLGTGARVVQHADLQRDLADALTLSPMVERGSTLLPIRLESPASPRPLRGRMDNAVPSLLHFGAILAIERDSVYLRSTVMSPSHYAYFPLVFRREVDPFHVLGRQLEDVGPRHIDFDGFRAATGRSIDYLIIESSRWQPGIPGEASPGIITELESRYRWVASSPAGRYHLYRRLDDARG